VLFRYSCPFAELHVAWIDLGGETLQLGDFSSADLFFVDL
jgi:hypothetical protein